MKCLVETSLLKWIIGDNKNYFKPFDMLDDLILNNDFAQKTGETLLWPAMIELN